MAFAFSILFIFLYVFVILPNETTPLSGSASAQLTKGLLEAASDEETANSGTDDDRFVRCSTSKGDFEVELFPEQSPNGCRQFLNMVRAGFFDQGIAFFRVNKVAIQLGADQQKRSNDPFQSLRQPWDIDPNPYHDPNIPKEESAKIRSLHPWTRGTIAMIGGLQMVITRVSGGHPMGTAPQDSPLGRIVGDGMERVLDHLYDGYGNAIDTKGQGPDQIKIFEEGMEYIRREFPKTDYISHCEVIQSPSSNTKKI